MSLQTRFCSIRVTGAIAAAAALAVTLAVTPCVLSVAAEPSSKSSAEELFQYFAPTGLDAEATQIVADLEGIDQAFREGLQKLQSSKVPDGGRLAAASVKLRQMRRMRDRLNALHEPAAIDLAMRIEVYNRTLVAISEQFWGLPQSTPVRARVLQGLGKTHPKRLQELNRIAELVQANHPEEAEAKLDRLLDDTFATAGCLNPKEVEPINQAIAPVETLVSSSMQQLRSQRVAQAIARNLQQQVAGYEELAQRVEQAAASGSAATSIIPEIIQQWPARHAALLKAVYASATNSPSSAPQSSGNAAAADSPVSDLSARMKQAVSKLLSAVAEEIPDNAAKDSYSQFVRTVGEFTALVGDSQWTDSLQAVCDTMAKRAGLSAQVTAYAQATADVLRRRERFATAQAAELSKSCQSASAAARQHMVASDATPGVYFPQGPSVPTLRHAMPQVKREVDGKLNGQSLLGVGGTLVGDSNTVAGNGHSAAGWGVSGWDEHCRLTLTGPLDPSAEFAILLQELFIDAQHPPLSLATVELLSRTQAMRFVAAGGKVVRLHVGAMDSVVQGMSVQEATRLPLGEDWLPTPAIASASQLALEFVVDPQWVQHRYFCTLLK